MMNPREYYRISRKLGFGLRQEATLLALLLGGTVFEGIGIGMILPIIAIIQLGGDAATLRADSSIWEIVFQFYGVIGAPVTLSTLIFASLCAIVCRQAFSYVRQVYLVNARQTLSHDVRNRAFDHYLNADASYHDQERPGLMVNNLTTELVISVAAILAPTQIVTYGFMACFYIAFLFLLSGPVTFAVLAVICIAGISLVRMLKKTQASGEFVATANEQMATFLVERLRLVRLIRLSRAEAAELADMEILTLSIHPQSLHRCCSAS